MSSVPMHDETSHPLNVNISPIQSQPHENLNITPIRNGSPTLERQRRETGSPNTLLNVTNTQNQEMEEEPLLYSQASLIEMKRSDYIPEIELAIQQDKYLVLNEKTKGKGIINPFIEENGSGRHLGNSACIVE